MTRGDEGGGIEPSPGNLEAYLDLTAEEIARLVLCLLIEERLRARLAAFRAVDHVTLSPRLEREATCGERAISPREAL